MTNATKQITNFPNELGWQGREKGFKKFNEVYGKADATYTMFKYIETQTFEKEYSKLDTVREYVYVCQGDLNRLLDDLEIYDFNQNSVLETESHILKFKLTQKGNQKSFIREPEIRIVEGEFYQLTDEEFKLIPFGTAPITDRRDIFLGIKLADRVPMNEKLNKYISEHFSPIKTKEEENIKMKYTPIIVKDVKNYVPSEVNARALELAVKHNLSNLEFKFLNYFYETKKALRNDVGQLFFDTKSKGIGWGHDREWVKEKMKRLMGLGLVKFEIRHDCRDGRYTSWYFYDAEANLDKLKHDF